MFNLVRDLLALCLSSDLGVINCANDLRDSHVHYWVDLWSLDGARSSSPEHRLRTCLRLRLLTELRLKLLRIHAVMQIHY